MNIHASTRAVAGVMQTILRRRTIFPSKIFSKLKLIMFLNSFAMGISHAEPVNCDDLLKVMSSVEHVKYSIPFEMKNPDQWVYMVDLDGDGYMDRVEVNCGNGFDASCEIFVINVRKNQKYTFENNVGIRFVNFRGHYLMISGVTYSSLSKPVFNNFKVLELRANSVDDICKK